MLKTLTNLFGPSGCEDEVRDYIKSYMSKYCDDIFEDSIGNLICHKPGKKVNDKSIMLCAHMDEVGFIIKHITDDGYLKFATIGGIDPKVLISKKVVIGKNRIVGVIGTKPPHDKNGKDDFKITELYIDVGAKSKEDALNYVDIGDYACFNSDYVEFGDGFIKAKALDDRAGCFIMMNIAKSNVDADIYFAFTVQEEVGCRGSVLASKLVNPEFAVVIEGTTCSDVPGTTEFGYSTKIGMGPAISIRDGGSYSDVKLSEEIRKIATERKILCQFKTTTLGGNDARSIQVSDNGLRVAALSVPCRYIHSQSNVAKLSDIENLEKLLSALIESKVNQ